jgi:ABC-2 type transport system permease protein
MNTPEASGSNVPPLARVGPAGRAAGLRPLLAREVGSWWRTRMWWVQALIWVGLLNGVTTVVMVSEPTMSGDALLRDVASTFPQVGATAIPIGVVVVVQGAIVGEKELGTAAWIMSKPASRGAFVLAKFLAHTAGFLATAVAIPAAVFMVEAAVMLSVVPSPGRVIGGLGVVSLVVVFYVALTLALDAVFPRRGPVAGIGVGVVPAGVFLSGLVPEPVILITPWPLGDVAATVAVGAPVDVDAFVPLLVTAVGSPVLMAVAIERFGHADL